MAVWVTLRSSRALDQAAILGLLLLHELTCCPLLLSKKDRGTDGAKADRLKKKSAPKRVERAPDRPEASVAASCLFGIWRLLRFIVLLGRIVFPDHQLRLPVGREGQCLQQDI